MRRAVIRPVQRAEQRCAAPPAAARGPGPFTAQKAVPGEYLYFSTKRNPLQRPVKAEMLKRTLFPLFPKAYLENYKHCLFPTAAAFRVKNPRASDKGSALFPWKASCSGKNPTCSLFLNKPKAAEKRNTQAAGDFRSGSLPAARGACPARSVGDEERCMPGLLPSAQPGKMGRVSPRERRPASERARRSLTRAETGRGEPPRHGPALFPARRSASLTRTGDRPRARISGSQ